MKEVSMALMDLNIPAMRFSYNSGHQYRCYNSSTQSALN